MSTLSARFAKLSQQTKTSNSNNRNIKVQQRGADQKNKRNAITQQRRGLVLSNNNNNNKGNK